MSPKLGLVTVIYNGDQVLDGFLKSVSTQNYSNYRLYIVDNSVNPTSTQLIFDLLKKYNLRDCSVYLPSEENYGVAKGNNIGIKKAIEEECDYMILLNNDIEFYDTNTFSELIRVAKDKNQSIVSPKIRYFNSNLIWYVGSVFKKITVGSVHIASLEEDKGQFDEAKIFESGCTCFALFHKSVFERVGLMNELYFVYMDDTDFFYRCSQMGIMNYYYPPIVIEHKESISTGGKTSDFSFFYTFRNRYYFAHQYYDLSLRICAKSYLVVSHLIKAILQKKLMVLYRSYKSYLMLIS